MKSEVFNSRLKQVLLLLIIIIVGCLLVSEIRMFVPGLLGAITLYIVSRARFLNLVNNKKWKKGLTSVLFITIFVVLIAIPIYFTITLVSPKVYELIENKNLVITSIKSIANQLQTATGFQVFSEKNIQSASGAITSIVPSLLNSTTMVFTNLAIMFFVLYYLYSGGLAMENEIKKLIPLKENNIKMLASETKMMIKANALGIPIICIVQGIVATLGYLIFGVEDWMLWGFLTGVFAFFPIVGTMIIWVPVCIILYANDHASAALGLVIYSVIVTGNVDYLARLSLLKKMGDVHPLITIFGVIIGINLFGFIGLVFGPLLISYFIILIKIYLSEFFQNDDSNFISIPKDES